MIENVQGISQATRCSCQSVLSAPVIALELPDRARAWHMKNFNVLENKSLREAKKIAESYVKTFPAVDYGLIFSGPCGIGKSHLAVAVLQEIAQTRNVQCLFVDFNDLLFQFQRTIGYDSDRDMDSTIKPLIDVPLLLLDDFASSHGNAWSLDMVYHVINQRYLARRHILITTTYDLDPSLSRRVGAPMVSRLQEMCRIVPMKGEDHRREGIQTSYQFS
ncbi:MAG TPA: ATP-binding protein [Thermoanaerobaculia bacterium]|nr:ATP-binding protein [Thermoanaerobaculia bacterium]HUM30962.1 ATP-binding protein [Thermoanaerobaculia bacterium]HXK69378.1 ATP-binding protein [Thermoanaerobaculia bacterium]